MDKFMFDEMSLDSENLSESPASATSEPPPRVLTALMRYFDSEDVHFATCMESIISPFPLAIIQSKFGGEPTPESLSKEYSLSDLGQTTYDNLVIAGYSEFCGQRDAGTDGYEQGDRYSIYVPSPLSVIAKFVEEDLLSSNIILAYAERFSEALVRIQNATPVSDLSFDIDVSTDISIYREAIERFEDLHVTLESVLEMKKSFIDSLKPLVSVIKNNAVLQFRLCFELWDDEPYTAQDSEIMVDFANTLIQELSALHRIDSIQIAMPKRCTDSSHYLPLRSLQLGTTKLELGIMYPDDLEATQKRISLARANLPGIDFDIGPGDGVDVPSEELDRMTSNFPPELGLAKFKRRWGQLQEDDQMMEEVSEQVQGLNLASQ